MGSGKLSTVVRGRFIDTVDRVLKSPTEDLLEKHLAMSLEKYLEFGKQYGFIHAGTEYHADQEFFGDASPAAYFPPKQGSTPDSAGKVGVLVSGYIEALRIAVYKDPHPQDGSDPVPRDETLPIVSYWITEQPRFEVYASLSSTDREVHLFILTPEPSHHLSEEDAPEQGIDENMWAIADRVRIDELHARIPDKYQPAEPFEVLGAFAQKLKSY